MSAEVHAEYWLSILFVSNEHPWRHDHYSPYPKYGMDDADAIDWAAGMQDGLGTAYQVTLFKDGKVLPYAPLD